MSSPLRRAPYVCRRCLQSSLLKRPRQLSLYSTQSSPEKPETLNKGGNLDTKEVETPPAKEPGPLARRLEEATEEALFTGGRAGRQAVEDAGFSDELKERLLNKIQDANFRQQYSSEFAQAELSPAAGQGTRNIAAAQPWTGTENEADAVLRMLDDAKPRLKPGLRGTFQPPPVDMRLSRDSARSASQKASIARDKASVYAGMSVSVKNREDLTDAEKEEMREEMRKELRERFQPGARAMPNTISGLASLANERIEDAIARGQFKNIPRGPGIERDARADNPFIDTTEYILNKMIQRQDIVPPWIEKQQELVKAAGTFRTRMRNDWRRHAARMMAARGGPLEEQVRRAEDYAAAEAVWNPRVRRTEDIAVPVNSTDDPVMRKAQQQQPQPPTPSTPAEPQTPLPRPYRDPAWEKAELAYMTLAIENLNRITRSYNLMAPDLAKKPYFTLQRELDACFAAVAPELPGEIRERATGVRSRGVKVPARSAGVLERFGGGGGADVKIHVEPNEKIFGFKEWWRDVWRKEK